LFEQTVKTLFSDVISGAPYIFALDQKKNQTTLKIPINLSSMFNYCTQFPQTDKRRL